MIPEEICVQFKSATKAQRKTIGKILLANYEKMIDEMVKKADYGSTTEYFIDHIPISKKILSAKEFIAEYENILLKNKL